MNNSMQSAVSAKALPHIHRAPIMPREHSITDSKIYARPARAIQNDLLAACPESELAFLWGHLELLQLSMNKELWLNPDVPTGFMQDSGGLRDRLSAWKD